MEKELAVSFNIKLNSEIIQELKEEQKKLLEKFSEQRSYDSSPHLAIATKFMGESLVPQFIKAIKNDFEKDTPWELEFADFKLAQTNDYIFLHLSLASKQKLIELHERAFTVSKNIGFEKLDSGKFRHFSYDPHISLIKVNPKDINEVLALVNKDMSGMKMLVKQYIITKQTDDKNGFANFPVVSEIILK